ncbi:hypothetical protein H4J38_13255 [Colwellia sp. BRX10-3]|uniref:hypothetical protein n=1 Tax=Colwellia sp. BRX10-3 TaxID=2759844 RepID=UPI0015F473A8|nr:hypothetical protein [Colwellia sp. BRX10-3]MBA6391736.1 hypothetical protein [Colwellia sp. BRX10-3]
MWRYITILLVLFLLAQSANASSYSEFNQNKLVQQNDVVQLDQKARTNFDGQHSQDLFNLPRINSISPATFSVEAQTAPNYVLVIEFFKTNNSEREFKNLASPAKLINWFEQLNHQAKSSRISGWKDGNFLYSSRTTYHS